MKNVFLIILNWNGGRMTLNCLKSLQGIRGNGFSVEIIVVDNGSTDDSVQEVKNFKLKIENSLKIENFKLKIIENDKNLGFAEGNNIGIKYALKNGADFVCLLNNDTRVAPDFLGSLIDVAESDKEIGMVGGKIYFEKGYEFHKDRYRNDELGRVIWYAGGIIDWKNVYATHRGVDEVDVGQYDELIETDYVNGCLLLIKKEVVAKVGLFDPKYLLYYEDADLSARTRKAGFRLIFCPTAKIWHLNSASSASGSELHDYFITRNRLLFGMRFAPLRSKIALVRESLRLLNSGRKWQRLGVRDFYLKKFGRGSWNK